MSCMLNGPQPLLQGAPQLLPGKAEHLTPAIAHWTACQAELGALSAPGCVWEALIIDGTGLGRGPHAAWVFEASLFRSLLLGKPKQA